MAKGSPKYRCRACGAQELRWAGRCSNCGEFNTIEEAPQAATTAGLKSSSTTGKAPSRPARTVAQISENKNVTRLASGIPEFDRVIGGGLVAGQVLLLAGEPGAGKSTLLLHIADAIARTTGKTVLYCSGEESADQLAVRARRIGATSPTLLLADDTELAAVIGHLDEHGSNIALAIVDSVQTIASSEIEGRAGGVTQVMEVTQALTRVAKSRGIPLCLVGQVTKDANVAGPRALQHTVDTTLEINGERHTSLRMLRATKNRYGPTDEVACFEQTDEGMREVLDPSALFLGHRSAPVPGTCITVPLEGRRALLAEVQALVAGTTNPNPRRGVSGLDTNRVAMLLAVTERTARLKMFDKDVFVATVGGMRITDPASDLAVCLAIASAGRDTALDTNVCAIGEVALSGDVRPVPMLEQRISEAARLGSRAILVPKTGKRLKVPGDARLIEVETLADALRILGGRPAATSKPDF